MPSLEENIKNIKSDFKAIKESIIAKGVDIPSNTPTSEFASKIDMISGGSGSDTNSDAWVRPSDWLDVPDPQENTTYILFPVFPNSDNKFTNAEIYGATHISWGDGSEETNPNGTKEHTYDYNSISNDTLTSEGFKQVLITITGNLSELDLNCDSYTDYSPDTVSKLCNCLEVKSNCSNLIALWLNYCPFLTNVHIKKYAGDRTSYLFNGSRSLKNIEYLDMSNATTAEMMFYDCHSLKKIPMLDTSKVTTTKDMFNRCYSLIEIPLLDTSNVNDMMSMFAECENLRSVPLLNTSNVTDMDNMFYNCKLLKTIPLLDTSKVVYMEYLFQGCRSLSYVPLLNTSNVTIMKQMFENCESLKSIPSIDTSKVTNMYEIFDGCEALFSIPSLNINSVTDTTNMFKNCYSLRNILIEGNNSSTLTFDLSTNNVLTKESVVTLFNNLTSSTNKTIKLSTIVYNKLSTTDISIATNKGWTITKV